MTLEGLLSTLGEHLSWALTSIEQLNMVPPQPGDRTAKYLSRYILYGRRERYMVKKTFIQIGSMSLCTEIVQRINQSMRERSTAHTKEIIGERKLETLIVAGKVWSLDIRMYT